MICCLLLSSCGSASNNSGGIYSYERVETSVTTTSKPKETEEETYEISDSKAKSIAKDFITKAYTEDSVIEAVTDRVYFGDVEILSYIKDNKYVYVQVSGHYWKKDKYGNSGSKTTFTKTVKINKKTQDARFYS